MRKVLLAFLLGTSLVSSFISTPTYGVMCDGGLMAAAGTWFVGVDLREPQLLPAGLFQDEERMRQEAAEARAAGLVFRAHYLVLRIQEVFQRPEGEERTRAQNRILEAQRQHLQAEWESVVRDLNFYLEQGWLPWERTQAFLAENIDRMSVLFYGVWSDTDDLLLLRWQYRLDRLIQREILPDSSRILEGIAEEALQNTSDGFSPAVDIAEAYRWARYCYNRRGELGGGASSSTDPGSERFADQIAYWDAQTSDEALWGRTDPSDEDLFFVPVMLDQVIEIQAIYTPYGAQTRIIVDDGALTQPHAHWGDLLNQTLERVRTLVGAGDTHRAELYMLFALYLKTGKPGWLLLLKEHSDADGPLQETINLPEINEETAPLFAQLLAVYLSDPRNSLEGSVYRSIAFLYLANAQEAELMSFLECIGQRLSPSTEETLSIRVGYARLLAESLGRGVFGFRSVSVCDGAYEILVRFIQNHLSIKGPFEGQASLASITPIIRAMIRPDAALSCNQLGRLLSWVQRMLGTVGFKKILRETYEYSEEQIQALVREALVTIGDIAQMMPASYNPHNEVINSMFLLWGHFTDTYGEQARDAMRRVVEHWSFERMEDAFNNQCQKRMVSRTWAADHQRLVEQGVLS